MEIIQIAGFLGCGKTTLMLRIARMLSEDYGYKVAMVVNELGSVPVDGKVVEESGMMLKEIGSGCICCEVAQTFANTVALLALDFKPDVLLVEPTGVAVPKQVKLVAAMGGRDTYVEVGPAIVLFDSTRPEELMDDELMGLLVKTQLRDADIVVISKVDMVDRARIEECKEMIIEAIPKLRKVRFVEVSAIEGTGVNEVIGAIAAILKGEPSG
jgi:G3E family GTPase